MFSPTWLEEIWLVQSQLVVISCGIPPTSLLGSWCLIESRWQSRRRTERQRPGTPGLKTRDKLNPGIRIWENNLIIFVWGHSQTLYSWESVFPRKWNKILWEFISGKCLKPVFLPESKCFLLPKWEIYFNSVDILCLVSQHFLKWNIIQPLWNTLRINFKLNLNVWYLK